MKPKFCYQFLMFFIFTISFELMIVDGLSSRNGPNYWGDAYPGQGQAQNYYQNPKRPEDYIFLGTPNPVNQGYDGSHYGTHDWIADAALRSLKYAVRNPKGWRDWNWLLADYLVIRDDHSWNSAYATGDKHNVVRSYYTFLFATQMPDMKSQSYPDIQEIDIPYENAKIKDLGTKRAQMWVGQIQQHKYTFIANLDENGLYQFIPDDVLAPSKANLLGKQAIKSITNKIKDENGEEVSAMQPEAAAGWLGSMTHYFGDVINPAHVHAQLNSLYLKDSYHKWFENHLASVTRWAGGPETTPYFSYDFSIIGNPIIGPIPPSLAVAALATKTIKLAYRIDGNYQYKWGEPYSGMYINDTSRYWNWKDDIDFVGREKSLHRAFYNKVEELLCWGVYYCACAMQYCYDEGKKQNEDKDPNSNYFAEYPPRECPDDETPDESPERDYPDPSDNRDGHLEKIARNLKNIGRSLTSLVFIGIARVITDTLKVIR